jgi:uncharacterized membrane protein YbhN (UPF0104 family)
MERMLDLIAIAALGIAAGYWRFRGSLDDLPQSIQVIFALGVFVIVGLIVALVVMRNFGRRVIAFLPLPQRVSEMYERFEEGVFGSVGVKGLPLLGAMTIAIWITEAMRLYFVVRALGFEEVDLAAAIVLVDRAISVFSVVVLGAIAYMVSSKPRGRGMEVEEIATTRARVKAN